MEMLYKKYHRSYVSQFREGARFKHVDRVIREVSANPFILKGDNIMPTCILVPVIRVDKLTWSKIILVFFDGRIERHIEVIEKDAI